MAIECKIPEISVLRQNVESYFGRPLRVHSDFVALCDEIFDKTKDHISETTLERLWNYSTRGYETVSLRTLNVLCAFIGERDWENFLVSLKDKSSSESDLFSTEYVETKDLLPGDRLKIGWQPDRLCIVRYLGGNRFVVEESRNGKLCKGDTFSCLQFILHQPLYLDHLTDNEGNLRGVRYGAGLKHGITTLIRLNSKGQV